MERREFFIFYFFLTLIGKKEQHGSLNRTRIEHYHYLLILFRVSLCALLLQVALLCHYNEIKYFILLFFSSGTFFLRFSLSRFSLTLCFVLNLRGRENLDLIEKR